MTKYISLEQKEKRNKKTVFTKYLCGVDGWTDTKTRETPEDFDKVVYLGKCGMDGDMFTCYRGDIIAIFKGIKGDEF
jgi:hypothetical protein